MLGLLQKYSRLFALHPVLSIRDLFLIILEYLNGQDLAEAACVSFYWKSTILSQPILEVRILKFKLREAHQTIETLNLSLHQPYTRPLQSRPLPTYTPRKLTERPEQAETPQLKVKKWLNFVDLFHYYAYKTDFPLRKRGEFSSEEAWESYQESFTVFYQDFLGYFKGVRQKQEQKPKLPGLLGWFDLKPPRSRPKGT
jgi:hypothetical protein